MILAALADPDPQRLAIAETISNQEFSGILPRPVPTQENLMIPISIPQASNP
jgi:hypothetical protein